MIQAIELQVITRLLISSDQEEIETLLSYDPDTYFVQLNEQIKYIHQFRETHGFTPTKLEFFSRFPDIVALEDVTEPLPYLQAKLEEHRLTILLNETGNRIVDFIQNEDYTNVWSYLEAQCEKANAHDTTTALDLVHDAEKRAQQVLEYSKQQRIPTGFPELDRAMYGGFSTVEELVILVARLNNGKSWICAKMMESAQANGFPVAYYSPEMQGPYLATRFDTWRSHFENSRLYKGDYGDNYIEYLRVLQTSATPAYILEDKDFVNGASVSSIASFVRKHHIKLLIIDGISYMNDERKATRDQEKYKNIALGLFQMSKRYGCAVVLVMQANREVRSKDSDKGDSIPDLFNTEGSDQPGRIATQAFGIRQNFEEHRLEIKLLKSRMANNQNPIFCYNWSINDGNLEYIGNGDSNSVASSDENANVGKFKPISVNFGNSQPDANDLSLIESTSGSQSEYVPEEDIEF